MSHRLVLNKNAPPEGYEYPLQVLKLHWMRDPAPLSPWVPDTGATNSSIINKAVVPAGQLISQEITYDPIPSLAENRAITLHAIRFEETEPDSGFDDLVRYLPEQRFDLPWLMVANSTTPANPPTAQVKLHFSPASPQLHLDVVVGDGRTATVSPNVVGGTEPVTLTITMDGPWVGTINQPPIEGKLKIEGEDVLNLVFYPRQTTSVAVHAITLINDDVETKHWYRDPQTLQQQEKVIAVGEGKPDTICISKTTGILWSTPKGDDWTSQQDGTIRTGPNGICDTTAKSPDEQVIQPGFGEENAQIIGPGPNQLLNTAPYISTYYLVDPLNHNTTTQLLHAAAHEMGHSAVLKNQVATDNKFGLNHPWDESQHKLAPYNPEDNFTSLDICSDVMRLMWPYLPKKDAVVLPGKFNKHEADKLHLGKP